MEPFNLFKFWRGVSGAATEFTNSTNIKATTMSSSTETEDEEEEKLDEGPFFDLEFKAPVDVDTDDGQGESSGEDDEADCESAGTDNDSEREYNFTGSASINSNLSFSPSDDNLFFKGHFLQLVGDDEPHSKTIPRKSSLFKLGFKKPLKPSTGKLDNKGADSPSPKFKKQTSTQQRIKAEEIPIMSLFTRENSLRNQFNKESLDDEIASEDKKFVKSVVQKYMKMIKPLYVSVSKRYGDKSRFYNGSVTTSPLQRSSPKIYKKECEDKFESFSNSKSPKQGNLPSGLRVVCKHLGKSRSSSNFAAVSPVTFPSQRQDDSMFQHEDGIQNAILHCKKSFNSRFDSSTLFTNSDSSLLSRSTSDPSHEKSIDFLSEKMKFFDLAEAENEEYFDL
ncbi:hypothetical protein MKW98_021997 [Papaver atlanticum]|uniref:Membrane-associated kinase regulator 2 n=1 Tax=Papaver atlanticum TaxID=357466 RepID=A0AAD4SKH1_9MAGN|nr:hypothetical protein MKW98_021997 [Papaver atlanticum]